jgi:hypothetical protein
MNRPCYSSRAAPVTSPLNVGFPIWLGIGFSDWFRIEDETASR